MDETLVNFGSELKAIGTTEDGAMKFGAWLVLFGDKDHTDASPLRDYFTKSTDFDIEDGDKTTIYYNHGLDPELKRRKLGTATLSIKDAGVWMEGQLKARDEYEAKIQDLIKKGKLGASSGVPAHLVERKTVGDAHEILLWPLGKDASLTPTPAEHRTYVTSLKSLKSLIEIEGTDEIKYNPDQPRDENGRFGSGENGSGSNDSPADDEDAPAEPDSIPDPPEDEAGEPVNSDDVSAAAEQHKLDSTQKAKLKGDHIGGKVKTRLDLVKAVREILADAHASYQRGKQIGESIGGKAGKSIEVDETETPEFKTLTELESGLRGGSFSEFPAKVRGAVAGAVKHIEEMTDARCVKSNRRWSETVHGELLGLRDELKSATETIEALADAHAPRSEAKVIQDAPKDDSLWAQYQITLMRVNGLCDAVSRN